MSKEIKQTSLRGWSKPQSGGWSSVGKQSQDDPHTKIYADQAGAIKEIIDKELTEPQAPTRLKDIKTTQAGLKEAVNKVNTEWGEPEELKKVVLRHIPKLQGFIKSHSNYYLNHTKTYQDPKVEGEQSKDEDGNVTYKREWKDKDTYKEALKYLEPAEVKHVFTAKDIKRQKQEYEKREKLNAEWKQKNPNATYLNPEPLKVGDYFIFNGYKIKDYDKFVEAVRKCGTPADIWGIKDPTESDNLAHLNPVLLAVSEFARELGIKPWGSIYQRQQTAIDDAGEVVLNENGEPVNNIIIGTEYTPPLEGVTTVDIRQSDYCLYQIILWALVQLYAPSEKANKRFTSSNINEETDVTFISKPPIEALTDSLFMLADDPSVASTLNDIYYNDIQQSGARGGKGGLPITITKPDQLTIFDQLGNMPIAERNDTKAIVSMITALTLPSFFMLHQAVEKEGGFIESLSFTNFMRINPRFNTKKARNKGVDPKHRQALENSVFLLQNVSYPFKTLKTNDKGKRYWEYESVKVFNFKIRTNENHRITELRDIKFTQEYLERLNRYVGLIYGEGFYYLTTDTDQKLDLIIGLLFIKDRKSLDATTHGEPVIIEVEKLAKKVYKSYDTNKTQWNAVIEKALNRLVDVGELGRWHTGKGEDHRKISQLIPESLTLYLYPSKEHLRGYITKPQRKALKKQEQDKNRERIKALKELKRGYRRPERLAKDLGITDIVLTSLLGGQEMINDELWKKIQDLRAEY